MNENKYQGYKNYQTWNVALHIANDYSAYHHWQTRAKTIKDMVTNAKPGDCLEVRDGIWTADQAVCYMLADELEANIEAHPLVHTTTMYSDILNHALAHVDWQEVADSILAE